jgi:hypothetical protein
MIASTLSDPTPAEFVVKSPIYSTAPKGGVAKASSDVRKTANVVLGGKPFACNFSVSTPLVSSFRKTVTLAVASGRHDATVAEAWTRLNEREFEALALLSLLQATMDIKPIMAAIVTEGQYLFIDVLLLLLIKI